MESALALHIMRKHSIGMYDFIQCFFYDILHTIKYDDLSKIKLHRYDTLKLIYDRITLRSLI